VAKTTEFAGTITRQPRLIRSVLGSEVNEEKNQKATGEADAFKGLSDEEAFFAVDTSMPSLTGSMTTRTP